MPNIQKLVKFILYTDDANIILTGANAHEIILKFNELSKQLTDWVASNGLLLNIKKTNYMIFANINIGHLTEYKPSMINRSIERKKLLNF